MTQAKDYNIGSSSAGGTSDATAANQALMIASLANIVGENQDSLGSTRKYTANAAYVTAEANLTGVDPVVWVTPRYDHSTNPSTLVEHIFTNEDLQVLGSPPTNINTDLTVDAESASASSSATAMEAWRTATIVGSAAAQQFAPPAGAIDVTIISLSTTDDLLVSYPPVTDPATAEDAHKIMAPGTPTNATVATLHDVAANVYLKSLGADINVRLAWTYA